MTKAIILSDTHGNTEIIDKILKANKYDIAIHAGDYVCDKKYMIKKFDYFVRGNNDFDDQQDDWFFEIEGYKFYLQHGHLLGTYSELDNNVYMNVILNKVGADVIIHGHTHITKVANLDNKKYIINPGSTILPRGSSKASYILMTIDNYIIKFEIKFVSELI